MTTTTSPADDEARRLARAIAELVRAHPETVDIISTGIEAGLSSAIAEAALGRLLEDGIPDTPDGLWDDDQDEP